MGGKVLVFPHDMVYDRGFAVGKYLARMEIKKEFAFRMFADGMPCEKVAKYIEESTDVTMQFERDWESQLGSIPEQLEVERSE